MNGATQYCSFVVGDLLFGIDVRSVQEVLRYQEMTRVPMASLEIGGLINLRGQIVTAIDLRRRLGLRDRPTGRLPMNVVVRQSDASVSLLVDEIGEVLDVDTVTYEPVPETLVGVARELITGIYKLDGRLLLVLDTGRAVNIAAERPSDLSPRIAA